jgi:hypothetical protein
MRRSTAYAFFLQIAAFSLVGCGTRVDNLSSEESKLRISQGLPRALREAISDGEYVCDDDGGVESSVGKVTFVIAGGLPLEFGSISDDWDAPVATSTGLDLESRDRTIGVSLVRKGNLYVGGTGVSLSRCA